MYTFWYVNMSNVTAGYGKFSDSIVFSFWEFSYNYVRCNLIKLLQILGKWEFTLTFNPTFFSKYSSESCVLSEKDASLYSVSLKVLS